MCFIGLWILILTVSIGCNRRSYWDKSPLICWKGDPFRLGKYTAGWNFEIIVAYPTYHDNFLEVRQIVNA